MNKVYFISLALLIFLLPAQAQTIIINGEKDRTILRWEDYTGAPDEGTNLFAYTYWNIYYNWEPFPFKGDTAKINVNVMYELGKNSWRKQGKVSDSLLEHEQGHFNIGLLCAIAFRKRINKTVLFRGNYQSRITEIFNEELEKYRKMELLYDSETNHFYNREQQRKWNVFLKKELERLRRDQ